MKRERHIMSGLVKTVLGMVLAFCVLFCATPVPLYADGNGAVDPTGKKEGYASFLYDNTTGLPTSEANALAETSDGFICNP